MNRKWIFSLFLMVFGFGLAAQSFNTAGGIRLGTEWGITFRQRFLDNTSGEFILQKGFFGDLALATALVEQHFPLASRRFNIYAGGGLHQGWFTRDEKKEIYDNPFGLSLILGLDYTVGRVNLSYDFKPLININGGERVVDFHTGLSVRYVMWKRKSKISRWFEDRKWEFWRKKDKQNSSLLMVLQP